MRSPVTKEYYLRRLRRFFDFLQLEVGFSLEERCNYFAKLGKNEPNWAFSNILRYVQSEKNRVEKKLITGGTLRNTIKTIKMFCEISDLSIPWKKISRGLPRGRRYADDRAPTIEEIRRILEYPDRRIKPIVFTVSSCGFRLGSWDYLKWRNVHPIKKGDNLVAAKIVVYGGDDDAYFSFITPEAYHSLNDWMIYREECGELINGESWVMRNLWLRTAYVKSDSWDLDKTKTVNDDILDALRLACINYRKPTKRAANYNNSPVVVTLGR